MNQTSSDPYNHHTLQKTDTMYLSTITKNDFKPSHPFTQFHRESSFLKNDIEGSAPKILIPAKSETNYNLSTFIEPIPNTSKTMSKTIKSNPLYHEDIQGSKPKSNQFKTGRIVNPLNPVYRLATVGEMSLDKGREFVRNTLDVGDINQKRRGMGDGGREVLRQREIVPVQGSQPAHLHRPINNPNPNLEVRDINKQGIFQSTRTTNPLTPHYSWRDQQDRGLNKNYGDINGTNPRQVHPVQLSKTKPSNNCLNIKDIEGSKSNSYVDRTYFMDKRREFRDYMVTGDIQRNGASSLKKGIQTKRLTNPLMPSYQFPGHSQNSNVNKLI